VTNVLIVDTDLGLVFWLGQALDAAGYETYPAKGVTEAVSLLAELKLRIDVLIVRHDLEGAETFASELRWSQGGHLKTVALLEDADGERSAHWDAWMVRPRLPDQRAKGTFLTLVQEVLSRGRAVRSL
jgi:hypothetical protein